MKRHIIAIFTAAALLLAQQASWAQMVVYDPVQTARSSLDALEQLMQTIDDAEQFLEYKDKFENMKQSGIIDPAKVTREAVKNAVSIAATSITMGALICEIPEKEPAAAPDMY